MWPKIVYPSQVTTPGGPFTTLQFTYPPRLQQAFSLKRYGQDTLSSSGLQQSLTQFVDNINTLNMKTLLLGSDVSAWKAFCQFAILRQAFDYYADASVNSYVTYIDMDDDLEAAYVAPGIYSLSMKWRQLIQP